MLIVVALVGVNLAGAIATSKYYPRKQYLPVSTGTGGGRRMVFYYGDGSVVAYYGDFERSPSIIGKRSEVLTPARPPEPSLVRIWSPVAASAMVTLLTLIVVLRRRSNLAIVDGDGSPVVPKGAGTPPASS